jgi:hypothetical protein
VRRLDRTRRRDEVEHLAHAVRGSCSTCTTTSLASTRRCEANDGWQRGHHVWRLRSSPRTTTDGVYAFSNFARQSKLMRLYRSDILAVACLIALGVALSQRAWGFAGATLVLLALAVVLPRMWGRFRWKLPGAEVEGRLKEIRDPVATQDDLAKRRFLPGRQQSQAPVDSATGARPAEAGDKESAED